MDFKNATSLDSTLLSRTFQAAVAGWPTDRLIVRVRWSRGADFSGTCVYDTHRVYINLGRHLRYPYRMQTYCARSRKAFGSYYQPASSLELCDGYQVCLFIFAHEYYHWLIKQAGRNTGQKESMCDRFAARVLVGQYDCRLLDKHGRLLPRAAWDFQDLEGFVAAARKPVGVPAGPAINRAAREALALHEGRQFLLFQT